jgi:ribosome biogenesis GTPase A
MLGLGIFMNIQWFPGHMAKTRRLIAENLKLVDVIIELLDARIPFSSRNPEIDSLINNKPRLVAFNKSDLADDQISSQWIQWYANQGIKCILINSITGKGLNEVKTRARDLMSEKIERDKAKGKIFTPVRTMVVGVPNVGKSSFINKIVGKATAQTGDRPGVTRGKQWIRINSEIELLDTPGILWPKFEDQSVGLRLALIGSINDTILDTTNLALELILILSKNYPEVLSARYGLEQTEAAEHLKEAGIILESIAIKRACLLKGGAPDTDRAAAMLIDDFRSTKLGRITLEYPSDTKTETKDTKTEAKDLQYDK